jgi:hypothetical protein
MTNIVIVRFKLTKNDDTSSTERFQRASDWIRKHNDTFMEMAA